MPAVAALPLIIGSVASAGAGLAAAKMTSNAAKNVAATNAAAQQNIANQSTAATNYASDLQAKGQTDALNFQKQQADQSRADQLSALRANYDLFASRERRLGDLGGEMLGMAPRQIPAYMEPQTVGQTLGSMGQPQPQTQAPNGDYQAAFQSMTGGKPLDQAALVALSQTPQFQSAGFKLSPANASGVISKIGTPDGSWVRVLNGDTSQPSQTVWVPQPGGGGSAAPASSSYAPYTFGSLFQTAPPVTGTLQPPKPGTLAAMGYR